MRSERIIKDVPKLDELNKCFFKLENNHYGIMKDYQKKLSKYS